MARPAIEATYVGSVPGKPPLMTVLLDVTLRNAEKTPRWFVFPGNLPATAATPTGGVTGVEVADASGEGHAVIGRWLGTAGFQTVFVPAGGEVKLGRFGIKIWGMSATAKTLAFDVVIAKEITVGGVPAASWYGTVSPLSDARAVVDVSKGKAAASKMTDDHREVKAVFDEDRRISRARPQDAMRSGRMASAIRGAGASIARRAISGSAP